MTQSIKTIGGFGSIALVALMVLALPLSFVRADGFDDGFDTIDSSYPSDFGSGYDTYDTSYPSDYGNYGGYDTVDTSYPYDNGYDTIDTSYPSYDTTGYSTGGYTTGGYSTGGYMTGGGFGYSTPTPFIAQSPTPIIVPQQAPSNTTVTTNTNTCTGNSCNTDDHSVVNITNPAPVINNNNVVANSQPTPAPSYPTQQYCPTGYYGTYPNCYRNQAPVYQQAPVVSYGSAPYVSLSQVPYTGLDLGFWGTIAYWGFMVAFALFAAYLIAIKRVQNSIALWLKEFLFGSDEVETAPAHRQMTFSTVVTAPSAPAPVRNDDAIDPFILSQINRRTA